MNKTFNDPNLKYSDQLTPLAQMADFEGGSSDLPTPTAADAGKVLTVDETGAYELGESSGNMIVTFTVDNDTVSADKTIAEIVEASATQNVIGVYDGFFYELAAAFDGEATFQNTLIESTADVTMTVILGIEEEGTDSWELREALSMLVPGLSEGSPNDVLTINSAGDGVEWAAPSGGGSSLFGYTSVSMPGAPGDIVLQSDNDTAVVLSDDDINISAAAPLVMTIYMGSEQKIVTVNSLRKTASVGMAGQYYWTTDDGSITLQEMTAPPAFPVQGHILLLVASSS